MGLLMALRITRAVMLVKISQIRMKRSQPKLQEMISGMSHMASRVTKEYDL